MKHENVCVAKLGLVLARVVAQGRVYRHADVVHVGEDLLSAREEVGEEPLVRGDAPVAPALLGVRLAVQPEGRLAAEAIVCIVEGLPVTEADDGEEDAAERLLGAQVVDAAH